MNAYLIKKSNRIQKSNRKIKGTILEKRLDLDL